MKTYYITRNVISRVVYREGCMVEANSPEEAKATAINDGDWNTEREIDTISTVECPDSYKIIED